MQKTQPTKHQPKERWDKSFEHTRTFNLLYTYNCYLKEKYSNVSHGKNMHILFCEQVQKLSLSPHQGENSTYWRQQIFTGYFLVC